MPFLGFRPASFADSLVSRDSTHRPRDNLGHLRGSLGWHWILWSSTGRARDWLYGLINAGGYSRPFTQDWLKKYLLGGSFRLFEEFSWARKRGPFGSQWHKSLGRSLFLPFIFYLGFDHRVHVLWEVFNCGIDFVQISGARFQTELILRFLFIFSGLLHNDSKNIVKLIGFHIQDWRFFSERLNKNDLKIEQ